jgi:hypothetical protein
MWPIIIVQVGCSHGAQKVAYNIFEENFSQKLVGFGCEMLIP